MVPNIGLGLTDDGSNETAGQNSYQWPYKPILLVGNKQASEFINHSVEISYAIEVTFRGLR